MEENSGFELSLLEGVDENLLTLLHRAGIRSRAELEEHIATRDARAALAGELGISDRRLLIIHHLNFLMPEERAERLLELERRLDDRFDHVNVETNRLRRLLSMVAVGGAGALLLVFVGLRVFGGGEPSPGMSEETAARIERIEARVRALEPLGTRHAETELVDVLETLGPAPGWNTPLAWSAGNDRRIGLLLGDDPRLQARRAVSMALMHLSRVETAPFDSLDPLGRAQLAAEIVTGFEAPAAIGDLWDAAGVLLRQRLRSRALGLAPSTPDVPDPLAAVPWGWTAPGFLTSEELMTRLEALPVREETLPVWSETLARLRRAADRGAEAQGRRPEARARDYWIRRGELEIAVVAALLGRDTLQPYHQASPKEFVLQRKRFLERVLERETGAARRPLQWLAVEYEETVELLNWMAGNAWKIEEGQRLVEALAMVEEARQVAGVSPGSGVIREVRRASGVGSGDGLWASGATRREAGLRPLLMQTRAAVRGQAAVGSDDP